jgi:hypothetical protein
VESNPLEHFEATLDIAMRFKQVLELTVAK